MDNPKTAIIIAAGRGKRLAPYTDSSPKCLVPVDDRTILEIQVQALRKVGVERLVFITGYKKEVLSDFAPKLGLPCEFVENTDWPNNNVLESLFCAESLLHQPVYLSYSDIIYTEDVTKALAEYRGDIGLVIDKNFRDVYVGRSDHPLSEGEVSDLHEKGTVKRVGKNALPPEDAVGEFIGLVKLSTKGSELFRKTWQQLTMRFAGRTDQPFMRAKTFRQAYLTDLLQFLIDDGQHIDPVFIAGQWREIDTAQDLAAARKLLQANRDGWK